MRLVLAAALALIAAGSAQAQNPAPATPKGRPPAFGDLGSNKEPIKIDADRLDVFDKESRAVFAGNVVAVQGDSTMKCTSLTVFYEPRKADGDAAAKPAPAAATGSADSQIPRVMSAVELLGRVGWELAGFTMADRTVVAVMRRR